MWYARYQPDVVDHGSEPVFVNVTGTVIVAPAVPLADAGPLYSAPYGTRTTFTLRVALAMPRLLSQATPSCTRSNVSRYAPGFCGPTTSTQTHALPPDGTFSALRLPSQTTALPAESSQWYARYTFIALEKVKLEEFVTFTRTRVVMRVAIALGACDTS